MASGIFAILDDIAVLMDDVAIASKVALKKTAGILGDDLAVNAEKATGFLSSREIPVLWAITKGSLLNKLIIVPIAILLNLYYPSIITGILILGGCYLAYEGVEKIIEYLFHKNDKVEAQALIEDPDPKVVEKAKIKSAVTTDFILSIEIVILALGEVSNLSLEIQVAAVCFVALLATVGVYGIVALIVRMDDAGFKLIRSSQDKGGVAKLGHFLVNALPIVIKALSVIGTIALLLVAGGIFLHKIDYFHDFLPNIPEFIKGTLVSLVVGLIIVAFVTLFSKLVGLKDAKSAK